jgi:hypothetical protein
MQAHDHLIKAETKRVAAERACELACLDPRAKDAERMFAMLTSLVMINEANHHLLRCLIAMQPVDHT